MYAMVGDRIILKGLHLGEPERDGEILAVAGPDGAPPYRIRWANGHVSLFYPGADTTIRHPEPEEPEG